MIDFSKIELFIKECDRHLSNNQILINLLRDVKASLDEIRNSQERIYLEELKQVREDINFLSKAFAERGILPESGYERELQWIRNELEKPTWNEAFDQDCICQIDNDNDWQSRAEHIANVIIEEIFDDINFLDFGCGYGHVANYVSQQGVGLSVGFDIQKDARWSKFQNPKLSLTTSIEEVKNKSPYDVILLYDVLDHLAGNPIETLKLLLEILAPKGRIYVRCHPFCSRHGTHLFQQKNKAYLHLILDDVELMRLGGWHNEQTLKVIYPQATYKEWFMDAGFKVIKENITRAKIEDLFFSPILKQRILRHYPNETELPEGPLSIQFIDYIIEPLQGHDRIF